jgi:hypothetical protein
VGPKSAPQLGLVGLEVDKCDGDLQYVGRMLDGTNNGIAHPTPSRKLKSRAPGREVAFWHADISC